MDLNTKLDYQVSKPVTDVLDTVLLDACQSSDKLGSRIALMIVIITLIAADDLQL